MSIPDFQSLMLPVLRVFADGGERSSEEVRTIIAKDLKLTPMDLEELLPSG
jgi:restriction system protein